MLCAICDSNPLLESPVFFGGPQLGSWIRAIRPCPPSELIVSMALRHRLPEFLAGASNASALAKFLSERLGLDRGEGPRLAA